VYWPPVAVAVAVEEAVAVAVEWVGVDVAEPDEQAARRTSAAAATAAAPALGRANSRGVDLTCR